MSYYDEPGAPQEYSATAGFGRVDPGIDISHYGAPYRGMLGLGNVGMLYRYGTAMGQWSPGPGQKPSDDPRMVKRFTTVRATYRVRGLGGDRTAARAASAILAKGRAEFPGNTVRKIGTTGWSRGGKVGYEVILASDTRAGEIKAKNFRAGRKASTHMGGGVEFYDASTAIPANAYLDAPPEAPPIAEEEPSASPEEEAGGFFSQKIGGLPVWAVGVLGLVVVGGVGYAVMRPKKKAAPVAANRRRRRRRRRRR